MTEKLKNDIDKRLKTLVALVDLVPDSGLLQQDKVTQEMNEMISEDYEPYFSGNAALHLLANCQRCGRCCREEKVIAISFDDCRRIAKHCGTNLNKFVTEFTKKHELEGMQVGTARMIRKAKDEPCPFYSSELPGCKVHLVKPQVCIAAFYLSKVNLLHCEETKRFNSFPQCPSDIALRAKIDDFCIMLRNNPLARDELIRIFRSPRPDRQLFLLLLRLKGMEIYFGLEKAAFLARKLGLKRMPRDEELRPAAFLYIATLIEANTSYRTSYI